MSAFVFVIVFRFCLHCNCVLPLHGHIVRIRLHAETNVSKQFFELDRKKSGPIISIIILFNHSLLVLRHSNISILTDQDPNYLFECSYNNHTILISFQLK